MPKAQKSKLVETGTETDAETKPKQGLVDYSLDNENESTSTQDPDRPALPYLVVGVGSSAGGLKALREVLELLPADTGMAFVLVPHLAPDHVSHLSSILEHYTKMPLLPIAHGETPLPNHLHVLQPNQLVRLREGKFLVEARSEKDRIPLPIDRFFRSLGADQMGHAIGVVLSGADADGALGLKALHGEGGFAIVQSPETADHSNMPRNSIAADHVDLVLPPHEIAVELARLAKRFTIADVVALDKGEQPDGELEAYSTIISLLRASSGLELRQYKQGTIRRRIARRMVLLRIDTLADYAAHLKTRKDELACLKEDVLINVTRFLRDLPVWQTLSEDIFPSIMQERAADDTIRIWSAGCSTGEEVYSIAMTLLESMSAHNFDFPIQIFGTDASARSIEMARAGIYPPTIAADISPERLRRFFIKVDRGYQVNKRVRDLCIFARQNLCTDPPFSHLDFVFCRNVLIYFKLSLQKQIIATFHYSLKPAGHLVLGSSESVREFEQGFAPVDRKNKIACKTGASVPGGYELPTPRFQKGDVVSPNADALRSAGHSEIELQRAADRIVLSQFGPPGLIVDVQMNVLQARGQTSAYVEFPSGIVSLNIARVMREGMVDPVREGLEHAIRESVPVTRSGSVKTADGTTKIVRIRVTPLNPHSEPNRTFLILFSESEIEPPLEGADNQPAANITPAGESANSQLRQDLSSTRFHLQSLLDERDARNQELVSANEEIQSANEELQSTNEELETTKEELQSANEELQTVNDELQQRNTVLTQTGNDLSNLLTSVSIPLLMLTEDLKIRQFTPPMERLLNVRASDIGRSISEIRLQLSVENVEPILHEVLDTLAMREIEVQDRDGKWHLLRIRPYRTTDNKIEGLVMMLVDVHQLRATQQSLQDAVDFAECIVQSVPIPMAVLNHDSTIRTTNVAFQQLSGITAVNLQNRSLADLVSRLWGFNSLNDMLGVLTNGPEKTVEADYESTTDSKIFHLRASSILADGHSVTLITIEDTTTQKRSEQKSAMQRQELVEEVEKTGRTLTHAQGELRDLTAHLFTLQEDERQYIARELHDDVSQRLSLLSLACANLQGQHDPKQADTITRLQKSVDDLNADVRSMSHRLHPSVLDHLGLVVALKELLNEFNEREKMLTSLVTLDLPEHISPNIATTIYRITQEALRNVAKHAGKTHVKLILEGKGDDGLCLEIRDFGVGFDQHSDVNMHGLGLISITERARIVGGKCRIESSLGRGTAVIIELPRA